MRNLKIIIFTILLSSLAFTSEHGMYLLTVSNIQKDINQTSKLIESQLIESGYTIQSYLDIKTPDYVREDSSEFCGFKAKLIVFTSDEYTKLLSSFGNKYLVAGFLRIGIYETPSGLEISLANLETINRVIFNDLSEVQYNEIISKTKIYRENLVQLIHSLNLGKNVEEEMEPIRDDEDLWEGSRDMFMMVGKMTFFQDEDQFPLIYSQNNTEGYLGLEKIKTEIYKNLKNFKPSEDDVEYRWTPSLNDLNWKVIGETVSPDSNAILLGLTRPRTEAVSFRIAGGKREDDGNYCPGIDHVAAYPIEVLIINEGDKINVYSPREMFRMDMYFWDAGKMAFMNYAQMPGMLDDSIKKALFNISDD